MATHYANGKTTTSGLVFMYDTVDKENCYKGEPTTNLVDYSEYQYLADNYTAALGGWDTFEGSFLIDVINKVPGYTNRSIKMTSVQANVYKYHFNVPLTSGQTYTVSFWGKATSAGNYGNFLLADGPSGYLVFEPGGYSSVTTEFTRFTYTFVVPSTGTYNFATYLYGDGQVVWLSGFQLENKSHATQYLPSNGAATLRSATQALKDLTNTTEIDISNVSFDANAQMLWDGTDDLIDITTNFGTLSAYTFEYVSYSNSAGNMPVASRTSTAFYKYGAYSWRYTHGGVGDEFYHTYGADTGWAHWVITYDGSVITVYENNVSKGTKASSGTADFSGGIRIGSWASSASYTWDGQIPIIKMYNRALTQTEITQNYNSYKSRFNLA
jgi:hypothetical protein